jgi:hypothetical protein
MLLTFIKDIALGAIMVTALSLVALILSALFLFSLAGSALARVWRKEDRRALPC